MAQSCKSFVWWPSQALAYCLRDTCDTLSCDALASMVPCTRRPAVSRFDDLPDLASLCLLNYWENHHVYWLHDQWAIFTIVKSPEGSWRDWFLWWLQPLWSVASAGCFTEEHAPYRPCQRPCCRLAKPDQVGLGLELNRAYRAKLVRLVSVEVD